MPAENSVFTLSPGMRFEARDAQWVVKRIDNTSSLGLKITAQGLSEIVRGHEQIFLSEVEKAAGFSLKVIDPANTDFAADESPHYLHSRLYIEAHLQQAAPEAEGIVIGHRAAMNTEDYQLDPARIAMQQPRQRILIADAVGLGKTLEAGILTAELIRRGRGRRILVLAVKSMLTQFQKEFWHRFTIPLIRLDSVGIEHIRREIPSNQNPFHFHDRAIISIDTLKQDARYRAWLEQAYWDIIIIDEAHNVAERSGIHSSSQRSRLARLLSARSDTLIMLSATPHDGKAESFASLMKMLNPTAIADEKDYTKDDIKGLFVRRFRKDISAEMSGSFQKRQINSVYCQASPVEEECFRQLKELKLISLDSRKKPSHLFRVILEKALLSSPAACEKTLKNRIEKLQKQQPVTGLDTSEQQDLLLLQNFYQQVLQIDKSQFSKYQRLLTLLKESGWKKQDPTDRLVIFTERIETMHWLFENLKADLSLSEKQIEFMHGGLSDVQQQEIVEAFGNESSPLRILVASDVAAEGINLHYCSHRLCHFDIPWSLMTFQQRNGRIDRYGQKHPPQIHYLLTRCQSENMKADLRILELLIQKDEEVVRNIGDPAVFTGKTDPLEEEELTAEAIAGSCSYEDFEKFLNPHDDFDIMSFLDEAAASPAESTAKTLQPVHLPSLFNSDYDYLKNSLLAFKLSGGNSAKPERTDLQIEINDEQNNLRISPNDDIRRIFRKLPREVRLMAENSMALSADRQKMQKEMEKARQSESSWSEWQYLWPLHPFFTWMSDKNLNFFQRYQAPLIACAGLQADETIFLFSAVLPNNRARPLIQAWFGTCFHKDGYQGIINLPELLAKTGISRADLPNPGLQPDQSLLKKLLTEAVERARQEMLRRRELFDEKLNTELQKELDELESLRTRHLDKIGEKADKSGYSKDWQRQQTTKIQEMFNNFLYWIQDSMTVGKNPSLQVLAAFTATEVNNGH